MGTTGVEISVLGPTVVRVAGETVPIRPRERAVVAALALRHPRAATSDDLVDLVWPLTPPATARKSVQNHMVRLRRSLPDGTIVTSPEGYRFGPAVVVDTETVARSMGTLTDATARLDHTRRRALLLEVVTAARGIPFADLVEGPVVAGVRRRFDDIICEAQETLAEAHLALGEAARAANDLVVLVEERPARERRWWLLMLARYRLGQRRDALATFRRAREVLVSEAGIEPGDELRRLERLIVDDDPALLGGAILAEGGHAPSVLDQDVDFVGRERELDELGAIRAKVFDGATPDGAVRLVHLDGEAGIGKTELAQWFVRDTAARGALTLWGSCDTRPGVPLQPFAQALDELVALSGTDPLRWLPDDRAPLGALSPTLAALVTDPVDAVHPVDAGRHRLHEAVLDTFRRATSEQRILLVIDDFHLASPATRRLAQACARIDGPVLVLTTRRTEPGTDRPEVDPSEHRIELHGLGVAEITRHLSNTLAGFRELDPTEVDRTARWLADQTGGNPLLLRELTRTLTNGRVVATRSDTSADHGRPLEIPERIRSVIAEQLDTLPRDTRAVVDAAAILGTRFPPEDLAAMVPNPARAIGEAVHAGVFTRAQGGTSLAFRHELLHRVAYDGIAEGTRTELHDLAASVLAIDDTDGRRAGTIARHRLGSARLDPAGAVTAARAAAERALAEYAYEEAADLYRAALDVAARIGEARTACELAVAWGDALRRAGDPANVDVLLDAAERAIAIDDPDLLGAAALALCRLGPTTEAGGSDERAGALAERALEATRDPGLRAELAGALSLLYSMGEESERSRQRFELALREARSLEDPEILAQILPFAYLGVGELDDLDTRERLADELTDLGRSLGDPTTVWEATQLRFSNQLIRGDAAVFRSYEELCELTDVLREPTRQWSTACLGATVAHVRGALDEAEETITASLAYEGVVSPSRVLAAYGAQLFVIRAEQGRLEELAEPVGALVEDQPGVPAWHAALARIAAETGDPARARGSFDHLAADDFARLPAGFTWSAGMHALGFAAAALDDPQRCKLVHDRLAPYTGLMTWFGTGTFGPVDLVLAETARTMGDLDAASRYEVAGKDLVTRLRA